MAGLSAWRLLVFTGLIFAGDLSVGLASDDVLWPETPIRIDRSKQHYPRLPAVQTAIDRRILIDVPSRIVVIDSARFSANNITYQIADIRGVQPKRLCVNSVDGGRWGCGRMGAILISNLVRGKRLLCDSAARGAVTVLQRCASGKKDVAEEILSRGYGQVSETSPLAKIQSDARKAGAGLWRNPRCIQDFENC